MHARTLPREDGDKVFYSEDSFALDREQNGFTVDPRPLDALIDTLTRSRKVWVENNRLKLQIDSFESQLKTEKSRERKYEILYEEAQARLAVMEQNYQKAKLERGEQKHRADMLQHKIEILEKKLKEQDAPNI